MTTSVSIASNALLMLGAQPINDFNEDSDRARLASNLYDPARDLLLRSHPWNCAIKRVVLSPDTDVPAFGYSYQFTLPGDWLRTLSVGDYGAEIDYRIEGRKILADDSVLYLRYIFRNDQESTWDTMLIDAMTKTMSATMAYAITQSTSKEELEFKKLEMALKQARAVDGQEDPPETLGDFRLLAARSSGRSW
jgi:hypothetical protein